MKKGDNGDQKTALITGGSRGIGLELARQFALNGYDLVLASRDQDRLESSAEVLRRDYGRSVTSIPVDLSQYASAKDLYDQVTDRRLVIDVLVNNAGMGTYGLLEEADPNTLSEMLHINIISMTALTRLFILDMITKGEGRILNVSSLAAYFSYGPVWASYVASKHYVLAFTKGLAKELSGTGVSVTALCPGPTATDFADTSGVGASRAYRMLPKLAASAVAHAGYRATMRGKTVEIPGVVNKVMARLGELPPRAIAQAVFSFLSQSKR